MYLPMPLAHKGGKLMEKEPNEFEISKQARKKLKDKKWLKKALASGKTPQEILEFSENTMNKY